MDILERIIAQQMQDLKRRKSLFSTQYLEASPLFERKTFSAKRAILNSSSGIIAEFKRRSPSKQVINQQAQVADVAIGYQEAGISAMSVLTNGPFFGGSLDDLNQARASTTMPLLRKDFIIDQYQLIEAKAQGADLILLIAASLTRAQIKLLATTAKQLELEVLLEVHNLKELEKAIMPELDLIGVNNRNLKTFEVSIQTSKDLIKEIPEEFVPISESGISNVTTVKELQAYGFKGFLMGENFMKTTNPGQSAADFINTLNQ